MVDAIIGLSYFIEVYRHEVLPLLYFSDSYDCSYDPDDSTISLDEVLYCCNLETLTVNSMKLLLPGTCHHTFL